MILDLAQLTRDLGLRPMRQAHLEATAQSLGCRLVQGWHLEPMMYVEFGFVEGPSIVSQFDYLVTLHELGHFALGHTTARPPFSEKRNYFKTGILRAESQAWTWAMDRTIETPNSESTSKMLEYFRSYGDAATEAGDDLVRHPFLPHVEFKFDHKHRGEFEAVEHRMMLLI